MYFNFTGLHSLFREAVQNHEPTVAFALSNGRGRFIFLIFIPTDSDGKIKWSALELFIILSRTQAILSFDLRGNHFHQGDFKIKLDNRSIDAIRAELGLEDAAHNGQNFDLEHFLTELNASIPLTLPLEKKIESIQSEARLVREHCGKFIDKALKIHLIGPLKLEPPKKPREETLRKLYYLNAEATTIAALIRNLKKLNWTVSWTENKPVEAEKAFERLWLSAISELQKKAAVKIL